MMMMKMMIIIIILLGKFELVFGISFKNYIIHVYETKFSAFMQDAHALPASHYYKDISVIIYIVIIKYNL